MINEPLLATNQRVSPAAWTWIVALSCSISYALTYFWRYAIFVLPQEMLEQKVVASLDLQACFSLPTLPKL